MPAGVTIDKTDLLSVENSMKAIKAGAPDAIRFATNNVLSAVKTAASKEIRKKVTAKLKPVNDSISLKKMFVSDMSANLTCKSAPLPLSYFKYSATVKGVKAQVKIPGETKLIKHSFVAKVKYGKGKTAGIHTGIFWRKDDERTRRSVPTWPVGKKRKLPSPDKHSPLWKYQLPMRQLYGPPVPDVLKRDSVMGPVLQEASVRYDDRLEYHTERLLDKARAA